MYRTKNETLTKKEYFKKEWRSLKLEITYSKFNGAVHEQPSTRPDFDFVYESGKTYIKLNQSALEEYEPIETVEIGEIKDIESIRLSQDNQLPIPMLFLLILVLTWVFLSE